MTIYTSLLEGECVPTQIEELILAQPQLAPHYQIEIVRQGSLDSLVVNVEPARGRDADEATRATAARALTHQIKSFVGISVQVVCAPDQVPRSIGKAQRVIDRRGERQ